MKKVFLASAVLLAFHLNSSAQISFSTPSTQVWSQFSAYTFNVNHGDLKAALASAGSNEQSAVLLQMPQPDGKLMTFKVWRNSLMPAALQSKFPDIWSFTASSIQKKGVTAKLEYSSRGLFAMVYDGAGTYFIDPIESSNAYKAYYKSDAVLHVDNQNAGCLFESENTPLTDGEIDRIQTAAFVTGATKRTYRLAVSCTGEYAEAVAGSSATVADVFAAMVTTMNRVNGIYERELAVTMQFIPNNDLVVYTSPTTDPYTANNNGPQLLGQNQSNMNSVIGSANYDIGHIFSTGGGGIAMLESVCANNLKARGVTGRNNPIGDPFDVDYVSHEIGHQFGADHSFNKCSGTENSSTAYETGSGSTIMGYAGICGPVNNIQNNSHDNFHRISLLEINQALMNGNSSTCPIETIGNDAPDFEVNATIYNIPKKTPFKLDFPVVTAVSPTSIVLVNIDQYDLGNYRQDESMSASFTNGPAFRSQIPDTVYERVFPRMSILRSGLLETRGERLSDVGRSYRFSYNAREIFTDGWGAVNASNTYTNINVEETSGPFSIIYPNFLDSIIKNSVTTIHWDVANSDQAPVNCATVDILLSTDGGLTFPIVLAQNLPNTGSGDVNVPDIETNIARIMVKASDNIFFTFSARNVVIGNTASPVDTGMSIPKLKNNNAVNVFPNPATNLINIELQNNAIAGQVKILNIVGQMIWTKELSLDQSKIQVNTASWAKGVYYIYFADQKGVVSSQKVLIQ